jgi:hypothetical protein
MRRMGFLAWECNEISNDGLKSGTLPYHAFQFRLRQLPKPVNELAEGGRFKKSFFRVVDSSINRRCFSYVMKWSAAKDLGERNWLITLKK